MSGRQLSESECALQQIVVLFSELFSQLEEAGLICTYRDVFRFCDFDNIDYVVLRYLNTVLSPFEEWAEEWLQEWEV